MAGRRSDAPGAMERREMEHRAIEVFKQAVELIKGGKDVAAGIDLLTEAIKLRPRVPRYYYIRGNAQRSLGRYQRALFDYGAAIRLDDTEPNYFSARGLCYRKLRRYSEALADFAVAIELDPTEPHYYFNRGLVAFELGDFEGSRSDFGRCLRGEGLRGCPPRLRYRALFNRAQCLRRVGLLSSAVRDLQEAVEVDGTSPAAFEALGTALVEMGDYGGAQEAVGRALEAAPGHAGLLVRRALCSYHRGNFAASMTDLDAAIRSRERAAVAEEWARSTQATSHPFPTPSSASASSPSSSSASPSSHSRSSSASSSSSSASSGGEDDTLLGLPSVKPGRGADPDALVLRALVVLASGDCRGALEDAGKAILALVSGPREAAGLAPPFPDGDRWDGVTDHEAARAIQATKEPPTSTSSHPTSSSPSSSSPPLAAQSRAEAQRRKEDEDSEAARLLAAIQPQRRKARVGAAGGEESGVGGGVGGGGGGVGGGGGGGEESGGFGVGKVANCALFRLPNSPTSTPEDVALLSERERTLLARAEHTAGLAVQAHGEYTRARLRFHRAMRAWPQLPGPRYHYALMLRAEGRMDEAENELTGALEDIERSIQEAEHAEALDEIAMGRAEAVGEGDAGVGKEKGEGGGEGKSAEAAGEDGEAGGAGKIEGKKKASRRQVERQARKRRLFRSRGLVRQALGRQREAVEDFTSALELSPGSGSILYDRAVSWLQMTPPRLRHAVLDLLAATKGGFDRAEVWDKIATAQLLRGPDRLPAAIEAYGEAIERAPLRRFYRCRRAQCYREIGDATAAEKDISFVLGEGEEVALVLKELAKRSRGHARRSRHATPGETKSSPSHSPSSSPSASPSSSPRSGSASSGGGSGGGGGPIVVPAKMAREGSADPVGDALGAPGRVFGHVKAGDFVVDAIKGEVMLEEHAHQHGRDAVLGSVGEEIPAEERARLLFFRGLCRYDQDQFDAAIEDFQAGARTGPPKDICVRLYFATGIAFANSDRHKEAVAAFSAALHETDEGKPLDDSRLLEEDSQIPLPTSEEQLQATHERAKSLQMLGRHSEALRDFTAVLEMNPGNAHALFRRAFSFKALRKYNEAASDFQDAKAADPANPSLNVNYRALHDVDVIVLCAAGEEPIYGEEGGGEEEVSDGLRDLHEVGRYLGTDTRRLGSGESSTSSTTGIHEQRTRRVVPPRRKVDFARDAPVPKGMPEPRHHGDLHHYKVPIPEGMHFHDRAALRGKDRDI